MRGDRANKEDATVYHESGYVIYLMGDDRTWTAFAGSITGPDCYSAGTLGKVRKWCKANPTNKSDTDNG